MQSILASNTILYCEHWQACVHFYVEILKFPVSFAKDDWFRELKVNDSAHISIANINHCSIPSSHGKGLTLSWCVAELETLHVYLHSQGVKVTDINAHSWRAPWFYAWDPEGNRIEFWQK